MASTTLTYADIVRRLHDLDRLALRPPPGERTALASSYDRASRYDADNDRYLDWGANNDGSGVVRMEGERAVLAEIDGPGCIWRIWAATVGQGHVRIYLDGEEVPAVDLPFEGYFDRQHEPFTRPNLVYTTTAMGYNNYTPIPFKKSCRIVADPDWGKYYQFTYTRFAPGTRVPTFSSQLATDHASALDDADRELGRCGDVKAPAPDVSTSSGAAEAAPGQAVCVADIEGDGVVCGWRLHLVLPSDVEVQRRVLRELVVQCTWDEDAAPAVWAPLGDFFGNAGGAVPFATVVSGLRTDGIWYCNWRMPFTRRARIEVINEGATPVSLQWELDVAPLAYPQDNYLRFHAKWHRDVLPVRDDRRPDWTLLQTTGCGRYVGTQLHVWNPRGGWWGEGDEKFFVDGESFPSTFGTGSEDYFGYAWSSGNTFVQALHSQPVNENNRGHVSANRWHIPDDVPFETSFEGVMEKYFGNELPCHFSAVAYWYLAPGGHDPFTRVPVEERVGPWQRPLIWREENVIEAEDLPVVKEQWKYAGGVMDAVARGLDAGTVSNDRFLIWWVDKVGYRLELGGIRVERAGRYRVRGRFVRDREMGMLQFELAGQKLGPAVDLYAPTPAGRATMSDPIDLGVAELTAGEHIFAAEVVGKNQSSSGYLLGIDYLQLVSEDQ